jgi:hypothetical protein
MTRKLSFILSAVLSLAGCGRNGAMTERLMVAPNAMPAEIAMAPPPNQAQIFSYSHALTLLMGHDAVQARYDRARESCLHDGALQCKLLTANVADSGGVTSAHLEVALPHDKIAGYEAGILKPLASDKNGVEIRARSTQAESVENQANDTEKKVAQLTKYRDGLAELAKRPNLGVDDFIKVQEELSKTEADLDEALGQKRDIGERIARESLSVDLVQRLDTGPEVSPLGQVWQDAGGLLIASTADVLRFVLQLIPWTPVGVALFLLLRWVFRIARRRPAIAKSKEANGGG